MSEQRVRNIIRGTSLVLAVVVLLSIPNVPLTAPLRQAVLQLTLIPVDEILNERELPKPRPQQIEAGMAAAPSSPAPYFSPSEVSARPTQITVAEPSLEKPEFGMVSEVYDRPPDDRLLVRMSPVASPLPDIITQRSEDGPSQPPAAIPGPVPQRGELYRGSGAADLEVSTTPSYTGPNMALPISDLPSAGLSHGEGVPGSPNPGIGPGDRYHTSVGSQVGEGTTAGLGEIGDLVGEGELSGLLAWLRNQHATFPPVVQSYLETRSSDLRGITSYAGWDIFVQFSEAEHQLKIFLARSSTGILLADSDFRQRSQFFGLGRVTRDGAGTITAIEAMRDKPSTQRTTEFYSVFGDWMSARGINMGSRAAK